MSTATLCIVTAADGETVAFGIDQATWLLEQGHVRRTVETPPDAPAMFEAITGKTARELDQLVFDQRELRHCTFCLQEAGGWLIDHDPVQVPFFGATGEREMRLPFVACDRCVVYVQDPDPDGLTRRAFDRIYSRASRQAREARLPMAPKLLAEPIVLPQIRAVVDVLFNSNPKEPTYDA